MLHRRLAVRERGLERIGAYSDGVFAIAATLLVLDLRVPQVEGPDVATALPAALLASLPRFLTFVLSFVVIGQYWWIHQRLFSYIVRYDRRLVAFNGAFLLCVTVSPFPTAVMSEYPDQPIAVAIYAADLAAAGLCAHLIWRHAATNRRLVNPDLDAAVIAETTWRGLVTPVVFALSIPLAFVNPTGAQFAWLAIIPALKVIDLRFGRAPAEAEADGGDAAD